MSSETKQATVGIWMPLFIKDRRAQAATLNHVEHSVLAYLEMLLWEHEGMVRDDDAMLARELRLSTKQWRAMREHVLRGCELREGFIYHPAIDREHRTAKRNVAQKQLAGRASAEARKARTATNGCSTAVATAVQPRAGGGGGVGGGGGSCGNSYLSEEESFGGARAQAREPILQVLEGRAA